jgi:hypothetical protein
VFLLALAHTLYVEFACGSGLRLDMAIAEVLGGEPKDARGRLWVIEAVVGGHGGALTLGEAIYEQCQYYAL